LIIVNEPAVALAIIVMSTDENIQYIMPALSLVRKTHVQDCYSYLMKYVI